MAAGSSFLRRPPSGARPARRTSSVVAALAALAPRLVRLAHHDYPDRLLGAALQPAQQDHGDTHRDRRVRDVEGGPVEPAPVEVEEVDHLAVAQPADQVPEGASQDGAERAHEPALVCGRAAHEREERGHRRDRHHEEERQANAGRRRGEHAEGRARVAHVGEREEGQQVDRLVQHHGPLDDELARLIGDQHERGHQHRQVEAAIGERAHATTPAQRSQRSGWRGSWPRARMFQQRGHFSPGARSTRTRSPGTSGLSGAPSAPPSATSATRKSDGSSSARSASSRPRPSTDALASATRASEDCLTSPASRAYSIALLTAPRTVRSRSNRAATSGTRLSARGGPSPARKTLSGRPAPGTKHHTSSAANDSTRAIRPTITPTIGCRTVYGARRPGPSAR